MSGASVSEIEPGIFIGNFVSSYNVPTLEKHHINARLSLGNGRFGQWGTSSRMKLVPADRQLFIGCLDSSTQDLLIHMSDACDFIDWMLLPRQPPSLDPSCEQTPASDDKSTTSTPSITDAPSTLDTPGVVLVHCDQGVSRSATLVIAYLMRKRGAKLEDVLAAVKAKRKVRPSANFIEQLEIWERVGYQIWDDTEKQIPKEPYAAYREKRAALLKAKG